jgi:hypothetical protein
MICTRVEITGCLPRPSGSTPHAGGSKQVLFGNGKNIADPREINFYASKDYKKPYSVIGTYRQKTVPVGSLNTPNALGLHDMSGNVVRMVFRLV